MMSKNRPFNMSYEGLESLLTLKGIVQPNGTTVKVNSNVYPIYYQYLILNNSAGEELEGQLSIESNIKIGSNVIAPGLGNVVVEKLFNGEAFFRGINESRSILKLHPLDFQSVVFVPIIRSGLIG